MSMDTLMALFDTKCNIENERNKKSGNNAEMPDQGAGNFNPSSIMSQAQGMMNSFKSGIKMPSAGSIHL